ncbi:MAG TPA: hypothetical protein VH333_20990, partial [Pseudonocardiaceae bacterium]|nr:hypothetical protein [Pseudonocardiaceae bacterium]
LSAGIDSSNDSAPLVSLDFRPSSDPWGGVLIFNPLGNLNATLDAGEVRVNLGISDTSKKSAIGSTIPIVVPPASQSNCR